MKAFFCFRFVSFSLRKLRHSASALVGNLKCNATRYLLLLLKPASLEVKRCAARDLTQGILFSNHPVVFCFF